MMLQNENFGEIANTPQNWTEHYLWNHSVLHFEVSLESSFGCKFDDGFMFVHKLHRNEFRVLKNSHNSDKSNAEHENNYFKANAFAVHSSHADPSE